MSQHVPSATATTAGAMPRYWMWTIRPARRVIRICPTIETQAAGSIIVAGKERKGEAVSQFDDDHHPDLSDSWKSRSADPRRIKFNHALHLAAGLTLEKEGPSSLSAGFLRPTGFAMAERMKSKRGDTDQARVRFMSSARARRAHAKRRSIASRTRALLDLKASTWLPIVYENHCAACHPLQFEEKRPEQFARHGISAQETLNDLRQLYMSEAAKDDPELLRQFVPPRPMPGQPSRRTKPAIGQAVDDKVLLAAKLLFGAAVEDKARREQKLPAGKTRLCRVPQLEARGRPNRQLELTCGTRDRAAAHDAGVAEARAVQSPIPSRLGLRRVPRRRQHIKRERRSTALAGNRYVREVPRTGGKSVRGRAGWSKHLMRGVPPLS